MYLNISLLRQIKSTNNTNSNNILICEEYQIAIGIPKRMTNTVIL